MTPKYLIVCTHTHTHTHTPARGVVTRLTHPSIRPFRVMTSYGCKILLLLVTGASSYNQKKAGKKGREFKLLAVGGKKAASL